MNNAIKISIKEKKEKKRLILKPKETSIIKIIYNNNESNQEENNEEIKLKSKLDNIMKNSNSINVFYNIKHIRTKKGIDNKQKQNSFFFLEIITKYLIMSNLVFFIYSKDLKRKNMYLFFSNITIKIHGSGMQSVFNSRGPEPKEIYINNIKQPTINDKYYLNETENYVKLVWNDGIQGFNYLFLYIINITYIDLTDFDFSLGIQANCMFYGCHSLTEIIFPSTGKIKITNAGGMFGECKSLTSLNVSNFDVSSVNDFGNMFMDCESLTSLDLSNFITESSDVILGMFKNCKNLEYLNLSRANFQTANNAGGIFSGTRNLVICSKCNKIKSIIANSNCIIIDCSSNWRLNQKRLNTENNECVPNCANINYKYDYLSKCFNFCPNGTYNDNYICKNCHSDCKLCDRPNELNNTNCKSCSSPIKHLNFGNCVDKCINGYYIDEKDPDNKICNCDLIKCSNCSKESFENNLCLSCNDGYYQKYEEINKFNPYIECYQSPEGYYLDTDLFYKKCYISCRQCNINGNETSHNCLKCKDEYYFETEYNNSNYKNCYKNCFNLL